MDEIERCRVDVDDLLKKGFDVKELKNLLTQLNYSSTTIDAVLKENKRAIRESEKSAVILKDTDKSFHNNGFFDKVLSFVFIHYVYSIIIFLFVLFIFLFIVYPESIPAILAFIIVKLPKLFMFAVLTKVFVSIWSSQDNNSWGKALFLGFLFSLIPVKIPLMAIFWWLSLPLLLLSIIPMFLMYKLETKQILIIVGFAALFSIIYDVVLGVFIIHLMGLY